MPRFKGYKNAFTNNNRIYSVEDILKMPMGEFFDREDELDSQDSLIGLPTNNELKSSPNVKYFESYTDDKGTKFPAKWESFSPLKNGINLSNIGTKSLNTTKNNQFTTNVSNNSFPELEELLRKELEKIKKAYQPAQPETVQIEPVDIDINTETEEIDTSDVEQSIDKQNNNNQFNQLINGLTQVLSSNNLNKNDIIQEPTLIEQNKYPITGIAGRIDKPTFTTGGIVETYPKPKLPMADEKLTQNKLQNQPQISGNLTDYINELLGYQFDKDNKDLKFDNDCELNKLKEHQEKLKQQNKFPDGVIQAPIEDYNPQLYGHVETSNIEDNLFRKPLEPIQDFINKAKNNDTDYSVPKTDWEKVQEKIYTDTLKNKLPMASETTENGMNDLSAAKRNPSAKIYSSINDLEDKSLTEKFKKLETDENIKGVVYDKNSKEATKISNSKEFNNYINKIINNDGISQKDSIEFKRLKNIFSKDNDLHYSLQNVTVHNPKVSDDGKTFTCKIIDVSDFKKRPDTVMNTPNNWGYNMQEKGQYKNYFQVIEIEVPLTDEQKELLRKRKRY